MRRDLRPWGVIQNLRRLAAVLLAAVFAVSLLLPWTEEWDGGHYAGWEIAFSGPDGYRTHLGYGLVVAWAVAVFLMLRYPRRRGPGALAAAVVCAVCPGAYWWELTRFRGSAFGRDPAGRFVEWGMTATPHVGYVVASAAGVALLAVGVTARADRSGRAAANTSRHSPAPPDAMRP